MNETTNARKEQLRRRLEIVGEKQRLITKECEEWLTTRYPELLRQMDEAMKEAKSLEAELELLDTYE